MRLIAEYSRGDEVKFVSHLDIMRTFQRILRRAGFPVAYSQGFNEHMNIAFATATSVGVTSESEYIDISLAGEINTESALKILNANTVSGITFMRARTVSDRYSALMAAVGFSEYRITGALSRSQCTEAGEKLAGSETLIVMKRSKSGTKETDIKPMIASCTCDRNTFTVKLACGSVANLNPRLFYEAMVGLVGAEAGEITIERISLLNADGVDLISLEDKE